MNQSREAQRLDALRIAAAVVGLSVALLLLWHTRTLVLTVFLGILFALAVSSGVDRLQRWKVPRGIGAPLIVFTFVALVAAFGNWIGPTVRQQTTELRTKLPEALGKLEQWVHSRGGGVIATIIGLGEDVTAPPLASAADSAAAVRADSVIVVTAPDSASRVAIGASTTKPPVPSLRDRLLMQIGGARRYFLHFLGSTLAVLGGIVLVIFLSIYLSIDPSVYRRGLVHLVPERGRKQTEQILTAIAITLRKWLVTQFIAMIVIGAVTTVVLMVLRVRAAVPLGILAGLLEFVPTVGPILSSLPAIAMGIVDSPEKALAVAIAYVGIQFIENHLLIPILMKEGVDLPPALTIVMQALMAIIFGILGLLVAVPLLAAVMIATRILTKHHSAPGATAATRM
ncbi:MAG: AI-2E family transporter [Gemmatimonadota bacterium]|nr:AI-2E family transporter [Gemmatimonadota bacterium]